MKILTASFLFTIVFMFSSLVEAKTCKIYIAQKKTIEHFLVELDKFCETKFNGTPLEFKCMNPESKNPVLTVYTKSSCKGSNSYRYLHTISREVSKKWFSLFISGRIDFMNIDGKACFYADTKSGFLIKYEK